MILKPSIKNNLIALLNVSIVLILLATISSCQEEDKPTMQEEVTEQLIAAEAWESPVVTVDGVDYSILYKDFTIKFEKGSYTSSGGAPIWPASGVWVFLDKEATVMRLDNQLDVTISSLSDEFLILTLQWNETTFEPGRIRSVSGKQEFKLKKR
jgi:hypothetical protein